MAVQRLSDAGTSLDTPVYSSVSPVAVTEVPMQLGRAWLTPDECQHRFWDKACLYCRQPGHFARIRPIRPKDSEALCNPKSTKTGLYPLSRISGMRYDSAGARIMRVTGAGLKRGTRARAW